MRPILEPIEGVEGFAGDLAPEAAHYLVLRFTVRGAPRYLIRYRSSGTPQSFALGGFGLHEAER
jgi:hypothetical protein